MELFEVNTQSFVIRVWLEETGVVDGQTTWRGHVTHVPSGKRRYIQSLSAINQFVAVYILTMGNSVDGEIISN